MTPKHTRRDFLTKSALASALGFTAFSGFGKGLEAAVTARLFRQARAI